MQQFALNYCNVVIYCILYLTNMFIISPTLRAKISILVDIVGYIREQVNFLLKVYVL